MSPGPRDEQPDDEAVQVIELSDGMAAHISTIESLTITPAFSIGTIAESDVQVLVPTLSCHARGTFGTEDSEMPVRVMLTFDNLAFLVRRIGEEYLEAIDAIESVSQGRLQPAKMRLDYAAIWLEEGSKTLATAARRLSRLSAAIEDPDTTEPPAEAGPDVNRVHGSVGRSRPKVRLRRPTR